MPDKAGQGELDRIGDGLAHDALEYRLCGGFPLDGWPTGYRSEILCDQRPGLRGAEALVPQDELAEAPKKEAAAALKALPADVGVSEGIKLALKSLSK